MNNTNSKHFKKFYGWYFLTLIVGFLLLLTVKLSQHRLKNESNFRVFKNVFSQYLFSNALVSWGIYLIVLSPLIYLLVKFALIRYLPTESKSTAQLAKTKNVISVFLGVTTGVLFWTLILLSNNHRNDIKPLFFVDCILGLFTVSVTIFSFDYAPKTTVKKSQETIPQAPTPETRAEQPKPS